MPVAQHPVLAPPQYYAECHGVIYVIDSTDEERLSESKWAFGGYSLARAGCWGWPVQSAHAAHPELALGEAGPPPGQERVSTPAERSAGLWRPLRRLGNHRQKGAHCYLSDPAEKMVTSEVLDGVPILVLANKQDVEVSPHCQGYGAPV